VPISRTQNQFHLSLVAFSCTLAYPRVFVSTDGGVLMKTNLEQKEALKIKKMDRFVQN